MYGPSTETKEHKVRRLWKVCPDGGREEGCVLRYVDFTSKETCCGKVTEHLWFPKSYKQGIVSTGLCSINTLQHRLKFKTTEPLWEVTVFLVWKSQVWRLERDRDYKKGCKTTTVRCKTTKCKTAKRHKGATKRETSTKRCKWDVTTTQDTLQHRSMNQTTTEI